MRGDALPRFALGRLAFSWEHVVVEGCLLSLLSSWEGEKLQEHDGA